MKLKQIFIYGLWHRLIGTRIVSRYFGYFANAKLYPPFLRLFIKTYVSFFRINMEEYDFDLKQVKSINEFFTRKLKTGARTWDEGISSPVDGYMLSHGLIEEGQIFQVKGMNYSLSTLLGQKAMDTGSFVNLYLSPADYHRVHAPFDMKINKVTHIPGKLLSVSKKNAHKVDDLYNKNERLVLSGSSDYGDFHFVFVGALNVGSIGLSFLPELKTNLKKEKRVQIDLDQRIRKGEELGYFEMGSTVIIALASQAFSNVLLESDENRVILGLSLFSPE